MKKKIEGLGGKVENKVEKETTALVSDPETVKEERSKVRKSLSFCLYLYSLSFSFSLSFL